jgi:hypothetical protein
VVTIAERLPILLVPEQLVVSFVWNNVVHHRCWCQLPFF